MTFLCNRCAQYSAIPSHCSHCGATMPPLPHLVGKQEPSPNAEESAGERMWRHTYIVFCFVLGCVGLLMAITFFFEGLKQGFSRDATQGLFFGVVLSAAGFIQVKAKVREHDHSKEVVSLSPELPPVNPDSHGG